MRHIRLMGLMTLMSLMSFMFPAPAFAGELANQFTISLYVNPQTSIASKALVGKAEEVRLFTDASGLPSCQIKNTTWQTAAAGTTALTLNTWSHVSCTYDKAVLRLYVNGVQAGTSNLTVALDDTANNFLVGQDSSSDALYTNFIGAVDQFQVYNYARTVKQIVEDMNAGHPAVGSPVGSALLHLKFDDGFGNVASNSGNLGASGNAGLYNMASPATTVSGWNQSGKFGKALQFDSVNDYALISNSSFLDQLEGSSVFTISFWAKASSYASSRAAITIHNNDAGTATLAIYPYDSNNGNGARVYYNGGNIINQDNGNIANDTWHYFTFVSESSTSQKLYVDSQFLTSSSTSKTLNSTLAGFHIGSWKGTGQYYDGSIDEIKMYNYALTADEVKIDYNRGSSLVLGSMSDTSGVTGGSVASNSASAEYCIPGDSSSTCAAPVGRWDFEEGTGSTVYDKSGNANNGTWSGTGTKHWDVGKVGKAGKFNGSSDYVSVSYSSSLQPASFTVSAWVMKTGTGGSNPRIVGKPLSESVWSPPFVQYELLLYSNTNPYAYINAGGTLVGLNSNYTITTNRWTYLTLSFDDTTKLLSIYVDGVLKNSTTAASSIQYSNNTTLYIGAEKEGNINDYLNGKIDQVRIFNYARSAAQIAWDYNRGAPVGHWKFDECQGTTANDSSGNNYNGTITLAGAGTQTSVGTCASSGATAWYSGITGKRNYSLNFDGGDDYISLPNLGVTGTGKSQISVSAWVNSTASAGTVFNFGVSTVQLYLFSNKPRCYIRNTSSTLVSANGSDNIPSGQWVFLTCTYDGSNIRVYQNGIQRGIAAQTGDIRNNESTAGYTIGNAISWPSYTFTDYFTGQIDDVRIYNYALTATQVKNIYNGGAVRFGPSTGAP